MKHSYAHINLLQMFTPPKEEQLLQDTNIEIDKQIKHLQVLKYQNVEKMNKLRMRRR